MTNKAHAAALAYMQTYRTVDAEFVAFELPANDIIAGDPRTEVATYFEAEDGSVLVGMSRFTTGTYRYRQTADEINYVTSGRMIITSDQDDRAIECVEGSVTRLSQGVVYTKEITEPYEEMFVMLSGDGVKM